MRGSPFRYREVSLLVVEEAVSLLLMKGHRIMNSSADVSFGEVPLKLIAFLNAHDVEMVDCPGPTRLVGEPNLLTRRAKKLLISTGALPTPFVPCRETTELHSQDAGLKGIQPAVVSFHLVIVLLSLTVVPQHPNLLGELGIVSYNCPGFSTSAQVLSGVKLKAAALPIEPAFFQRCSFLKKYSAPWAWQASSITIR